MEDTVDSADVAGNVEPRNWTTFVSSGLVIVVFLKEKTNCGLNNLTMVH